MDKVTFRLLLTGLFLMIFHTLQAQVKWMTFEEAFEAWQKEPRPILVDLYTDWCGWCKRMDKATYEDKRVINYINQKYYAVRYNAESKNTVVFNNRSFGYKAEYRANEIAVYLTGGQLQYPTTVFLSSPSAPPAPLAGYMVPKDFEAPVKFFGEKKENAMNYQAFSSSLKREW